MVVEMTYNSARRDLVIPEYGRTIQEMVDHLLLTPQEVSWSAAISSCEKGQEWEMGLRLS